MEFPHLGENVYPPKKRNFKTHDHFAWDVTSFGPIRLDQMAGKSLGQSHIWWLTYPY